MRREAGTQGPEAETLREFREPIALGYPMPL